MKKAGAHKNLQKNWSEREKLRDKGQFWTPGWVAEAMVSYVAQDTKLVFDPAAGRGAFFDALLRLKRTDISFFGTDIDGEVLKDEIYKKSSCHLELRDFIKTPPQGRFSAIVANPPYIRHHRIDEETKAFLRRLCKKITGFTIDGRAGYHIYFLLQALNLLEADGRLAFIMPADTCEGTFAKKLWAWITRNYCLECVITFDEKATPFPNVDTNAIVFLIKNSTAQKTLHWVRTKEAYSQELIQFISSDFNEKGFTTIEVHTRRLEEALTTGLSRSEQDSDLFAFHLKDFAHVVRGIATGANEFFFLTRKQASELKIPDDFLKLAVGRTKDIPGDSVTSEDIERLDAHGRPTLLFSVNGHIRLPDSVSEHLKAGEKAGLPDRSLIKQRKPWYKTEKREIPPLLFAYLGRRNSRFISNKAGVLPLTSFLCVYPIYRDEAFIDNLWQALNHPETLKNLSLVGKSYGAGALKVEPRNLEKLPIPDHIVELFHLKRQDNPVEHGNLFHLQKKGSLEESEKNAAATYRQL